MDDEQMLKRSTTGAVDPIESEFGTATAAFATAQPRSRRVTWSVVVDVCAVVAVVASVTAVVTSHARHPSDSAANARPMLVPVTAGSLANYRWSVLPAAPFETRGGTVAVWTGQQMIIWGGNSSRLDAVLHADGAAYDPAARTWDSLPPSPLTARASSASVWTGTSVFVWGGYVGYEGKALTDGALYTPADKRWTPLPPAPITTYSAIRAFWTGTVVVLLSTSAAAGDDVDLINAQTYNPATRSWARLPDLLLPAGRPADVTVDVGAGDRIYLWSMWSHDVSAGVDSYTLDTASGQWSANSLRLPAGADSQALWTGHDVLQPATSSALGMQTSGPAPPKVSGVVLDPTTASTQTIVHGPVDDLHPQYIWTGGALLAFNNDVDTSGVNGHSPGEAAAWDPLTNHWTHLRSAPLYSYGSEALWTGTSLLMWGGLIESADGNPTTSTGLEFRP